VDLNDPRADRGKGGCIDTWRAYDPPPGHGPADPLVTAMWRPALSNGRAGRSGRSRSMTCGRRCTFAHAP